MLLTPEQRFATGVTVIVAVTGVAPLLSPLKEAISPVPLAAKPIDVVLFVQLNAVPITPPLNVTAEVAIPLHTV